MTTATAPRAASTGGRAPGPRGNLLMGSLPAYKRNPVRFFCDLQEAYGDVVRFRLGPYPCHLITHPDGISHVIQVNDRNYCRGRFYEKFKIFFGHGLLTLDGEDWRTHRHVAQPAFLRTVISGAAPHVVAATAEMLDRWDRYAGDDRPLPVIPEAMRLTLATLSRTLFGLDVSDEHQPIGQAVDFGVKTMFNQGTLDEMLPSWLPTRRNKGIAVNRVVLAQMVQRIRSGHDRGTATVDLVDLFEAAIDPRTGQPWTEREILDEVLTVFLAGQETSAMALSWAVQLLGTHPEVLAELAAEADPLTDEDLLDPQLKALPYAKMVVEETLRMHPPIWLYTRDALADDEVLGYRIPAGSSVLVSPFATHRRTDLWPDPDEFRPRRFDPASREKRARFAYFPFGGGPRQCIGMHMALHELQIMVAMIAKRFDVEVPGGPADVGEAVLSLRPAGGVTVRLRRRQPAGTAGGPR
jgi:cytochrome P450